MLNWIGIVGICYLVIWNFMGFAAWITMRKKEKIAKWMPVLIFILTVVTFLLGYFSHD
jgi:heme/copper-type cytochrome/quinol oxidase subunit 2